MSIGFPDSCWRCLQLSDKFHHNLPVDISTASHRVLRCSVQDDGLFLSLSLSHSLTGDAAGSCWRDEVA